MQVSLVLSRMRENMQDAAELLNREQYQEAYTRYISIAEQSVAMLKQSNIQIAVLDKSSPAGLEEDQVSEIVRWTDECLVNIKVIHQIIKSRKKEVSSTVTAPSSSDDSSKKKPSTSAKHDVPKDKFVVIDFSAVKRNMFSNNKFKWSAIGYSADKWTRFVDSNFDYLKMSNEKMRDDYNFLTQFTTQAMHIDPSMEYQDNSLQLHVKQLLTDYLKKIIRDSSHAIHKAIVSLSNKCVRHYDSAFLSRYEEQKRIEMASELVKKAVFDVGSFCDRLVQSLLKRYWAHFITDSIYERISDCENVVYYCTLGELLSLRDIYDKLFSLYCISNTVSDRALSNRIQQIQTKTMEFFQVEEQFRLEYDESLSSDEKPYQTAIDILKTINDDKFSPQDIIQCIIGSLREISECVTRYYEKLCENFKEVTDVHLAADDLVSVFSYVLSHANPRCLFATLNYLNDFMHPDLLKGEAGYSIATLETTMNYIIQMDIQQLQLQHRLRQLEKQARKPLPPTPLFTTGDDDTRILHPLAPDYPHTQNRNVSKIRKIYEELCQKASEQEKTWNSTQSMTHLEQRGEDAARERKK